MNTKSHDEYLPELKKNGRFAIILIMGVIMLCWFMKPDDSMTKCQETHSFDVCFEQINR